jgi:hypothetical protein
MPATYFDAQFCVDGLSRLLAVDDNTVANVVSNQVPAAHLAMMLVNSTIYGGSGGQVPTFSMAPGADEIGLHEMGHSAFGLADEYPFWVGCGLDVGHDHHPPVEPAQPNVTIDSNPATIKWGALISASTPMPTTANADCSVCDPQWTPLPMDTVGAFEGADYYHCGAYRGQFVCRMRLLSNPFCAVCQLRILSTLEPYLPLRVPPLRHFLTQPGRDSIVDPSPIDLVRFGEAARDGGQADVGLVTDELSQLLSQIDSMNQTQLRTMLLRIRSNQARLAAAAEMIEAQLGEQSQR